MKLFPYLKDKSISIILYISTSILILLLLAVFKTQSPLVIAITILLVILGLLLLLIDYLNKKKFYDNIIKKLSKLDKKYLILEILEEPSHYEEKLFNQILYEINKSYLEELKKYKSSIIDFKEYVELWIHEVKIPISSLSLMVHNNKQLDKKYKNQIRKLDNYIDQVLYYVRSENASNDYIIKETSLSKIINSVALKNKDDLLENKINFIVKVKDEKVMTDEKWLEFILNQIINNSIKYKRNKVDSYIEISVEEDKNLTYLSITDNGVGIPKSNLPKVFDKSFTGENGRLTSKSTGLGLYIVKNLCEKLGHKIKISSEVNNYTKVTIIISKNNFYFKD